MTEVLRSAIAEVEQYSRVKLVPPIDGTLRGHAVADVIHLLAELVENATVFSAPHTQVLLRVNLVTSGLAVEVEDRGLGMPAGEQSRMNALLTDPDQVNVASLLADGRIGLFVVSQLARRHGIHVRLQTNIYGGTQAVLVVPQALLGTAQGAPRGRRTAAGHLGGGSSSCRRSRFRRVGRTGGTDGGGQHAVGQGAPGRHQREAGASGRHQRRDSVPAAAPAPNGGGPVPLPVRGAHAERANPLEAVPGIRADDRRTVAENVTAAPVPRGGAVRGTMGKPPQLPRRRAQEHIAPQLRDGPTPRQDTENPAGHDPDLMAAFQRGIGLAEAQQHMEAAEAAEAADGVVPSDGGEAAASHLASDHMASDHTSSAHMEFPHANGTDTTGGVHTGGVYLNALHAEPSALDANTPVQPPHMSATHMGSGYLDTALHRYTAHTATPDTETDRFTLAPTWTRPPCPKRTAMCPDMTTTSPPGTTGAHQPDDHAGPHPHAQRHPHPRSRRPSDPKESIHHGERCADRPADRPCIRPRLADERPRAARAAHHQRGPALLRRAREVGSRARPRQRRPHGGAGLRAVLPRPECGRPLR